MRNFVFVVDGEVAANYSFPQHVIDSGVLDKQIAILASNPTIIETTQEIVEGSTYNGSRFLDPA